MRRTFPALLLAFLVLPMIWVHAAEPVLTKVVLKTVTGDEDRDHDTAVFVYVTERDGRTVLAQIAYAETGGQYGYADHTTHELQIPSIRPEPGKRETPAFCGDSVGTNSRVRQRKARRVSAKVFR